MIPARNSDDEPLESDAILELQENSNTMLNSGPLG